VRSSAGEFHFRPGARTEKRPLTRASGANQYPIAYHLLPRDTTTDDQADPKLIDDRQRFAQQPLLYRRCIPRASRLL